MGNIAACTPVMKPFLRYVRARISGHDPHGILRRKSTTTPRWHFRWISSSSWAPRGGEPTPKSSSQPIWKSNPSVPHAQIESQGFEKPYALGTRLPVIGQNQFKTNNRLKANSLELPIQGTLEASDIYEELPGLKTEHSKRSLQTGHGRRVNAYDRV